jgi:hypothetical protein
MNYYSSSLTESIARRLQRSQSRGKLIDWPPQNMIRRRPPTRGKYRVRKSLYKAPTITRLPSGNLPKLSSVTKQEPQVRGLNPSRYPFLRGI